MENEYYGEQECRLFVPLPDNCTPAGFLAIGYFVVGQIQKHYPSFFKQNIVEYAKFVSEIFGQNTSPVVE